MEVAARAAGAIVVQPAPAEEDTDGIAADAPAFTHTAFSLEGHGSAATAVAFLQSAPLLLSASADRTALLWDLADEELPAVLALRGARAALTDIALLEERCAAALSDARGELHVHDLAGGERIARIRAHDRVPCNSVVALGAHELASAGNDGTLRVWDLRTRMRALQPALELSRGPPLLALAHVRDRALVAAGLAGAVRMHDARSAAAPSVLLTRHDGLVAGLAAGPTGAAVASLGADGLRISDARALPGPGGRARAHDAAPLVPFEPRLPRVAWRGHAIVAGAADGVLRVWSAADDELKALFAHPMRAAPLNAVDIHHQLDVVASAAEDGSVHLAPLGAVIAQL